MKSPKESKALTEVRKWKAKAARETKKLKGKALLDYYNRSNPIADSVSHRKAA